MSGVLVVKAGLSRAVVAAGLRGRQGEQGEQGAPFEVNATGVLANRGAFDGEGDGFSYLATDTGDLYFRQGAAGNWSAPVPFQGPAGDSAYQVAVKNGFVGTETEWLEALSGTDGTSITAVTIDSNGHLLQTLSNGTVLDAGYAVGQPGTDGADGYSAYEVAVAGGFVGTEAQWLASLVGQQGEAGAPLGDAAPEPLGNAAPGVSGNASREDHAHPLPTPGDIGAATAAQGALADTAVQPGDLATVATSGDYDDLTGKPTLGTAAATAATDYATAAQGATADSAVQPGDLATVATSGAYADLTGKPTIPSTAAEVGAIATTEKGAASGVATLGSDSKIPLAQLPATAITSTHVVANEAAMLALAAQEGDVAIRPDINTSFILAAEPASTLSNWQEILAPSAGGGAPVGSSTPQPLGTATPGVSSSASRQDHVHPMPSAADVGAAPISHVGAGGGAHADVVPGGASGFMTGAQASKLAGIEEGAQVNHAAASQAEAEAGSSTALRSWTAQRIWQAVAAWWAASAMKTKLDGIAAGATANSSDATLLSRANHTGTQAASTISDFSTAAKAAVPQCIPIACSDETTALTVGTAKVTFRMPYGFTLSAVRASLTVAQTSGSIFTVDINEGGTSILSTKLTIDNTEKTSTTAATAAVISDASLANDAEITIDIDQIGDGTAKGLKVVLIGVPA